jgi:predicted RNA-binding Zn-ribbon protein involved in translation (DUF1610 family)
MEGNMTAHQKPNAQQCEACGDTHAMPLDDYFDACPSCGNATLRAIATLEELAEHLGAAHPTVESIAKRLFKDTECGISFTVADGECIVAGYVEESDTVCPPYKLRLGYFTAEQFDRAVEMADEDGCRIFNEGEL